MTNLEWVKNNFNRIGLSNDNVFCEIAFISKTGKSCVDGEGTSCRECQFRNISNAIDYLLQEHKEPIKLKQWEYDTIKYHGKLSKFNDIYFLMAMKNKGYFKDMNSVEKCSMTIKEILDNCEVIE